VKHFYGLALGLAQESNTVTLFLVQNSVLTGSQARLGQLWTLRRWTRSERVDSRNAARKSCGPSEVRRRFRQHSRDSNQI